MEKPRITTKVETESADTPITIPVFKASVVVQKTASTLLHYITVAHQSIDEDVYLEKMAAVEVAPMPAPAAR